MGIELAEEKKSYEEQLYDLTKLYTTQDITRVIELEIQAAGLIVMPAFAGMITLGGFLYGFDIDNRSAFIKFARHRMNMPGKFSEILYDNVYLGLCQGWLCQTRITLWSKFSQPMGGNLWFQNLDDNPKQLHVNALYIGLEYKNAVEKLPEFNKIHYRRDPDYEGQRDMLRGQIGDFMSGDPDKSRGVRWTKEDWS